MQNKLDLFFTKYEFVLPLLIFILFMFAALPGITWGAPSLWNPDELVWRVSSALRGELIFDETEPDWNYPSLPKYVMYGIGLITYALGQSDFAFLVSARIFSSILGALGGVLIYYITQKIYPNKLISTLAGILYVVSGVVVANARFAHNDLYLQFFTVLCLYCVIHFHYSRKIIWLFASFLIVGMAASSKYTGASLLFLPISVFIFMNLATIRREWLSTFKVLGIGALFVILGYGIGTPRLFLAPIDYLSNAIPAAIRFSQYGFNSGTVIGLYGQWEVFKDGVGFFEYYLFLAGFIFFVSVLFLSKFRNTSIDKTILPGIAIVVLNIIIFDLPFLVSINYVPRHFIPFVPLFAILSALFIDQIFRFIKNFKIGIVSLLFTIFVIAGIAYSSLRLVSIALLFMNDARISASEYIAGIRGFEKSIEYTLYPPIIEKQRFMRAHNYPIYFVKYATDLVPTGGRYEYNLGEQGLLERNTDYFVIDSNTYNRFYNDSICSTINVECDFFKKLLNGEVDSYKLIAEFNYSLPPYLPQLTITFVNPDIKIYQKD